MRQDLVQTSVTLPRELAERLARECRSVSAYLRALLEADTWELDRAREQLGRAGVGGGELGELAASAVAGVRVVEAARRVAGARDRGREVELLGVDEDPEPAPPPPAHPPLAVTERQLNAITAIGRGLGWSSEAIRQRSIDAFGAPPNQLSRAAASSFIDDLKKLAIKEATR